MRATERHCVPHTLLSQSTFIQRQLARYFFHGMRHYAVPALVALLQPLAVVVSGTQSAPARDAHEAKQRQALQLILRQLYDKLAARPGAAEHIGGLAEWGRRSDEKEKEKEKEKDIPKNDLKEQGAKSTDKGEQLKPESEK